MTDTVDRDSGGPPWRQVAEILRRRIASGQIRGRLPSERDLAFEFEVNLKTIRKALAGLRDEGLIVTEQGYGSRTAGPDGTAGE